MIHRAHDYRELVRRWRSLARRSGLKFITFGSSGGFDLLCLQSPALAETGGLYISAGIHGDEPGSTEGLVAWAEKHVSKVRTFPVLLFPCLNPWGLLQNCRLNEAGIDLNRAFRGEDPAIVALREKLRGFQFTAALTLHEDYDA